MGMKWGQSVRPEQLQSCRLRNGGHRGKGLPPAGSAASQAPRDSVQLCKVEVSPRTSDGHGLPSGS